MFVIFDFFPETFDMYVNGTCVTQIFIAPDVVQKLFPGEHLIWRGSEEIQKFQLLWRHVDDLSVIHDRVVRQIDHQIRIFHTFDLRFCLNTALTLATNSLESNGLMI